MRIDSVISHGDWFQAFGTYGTPSIYWLNGLLREAGISTVHWRTMWGARASYPSKHEALYWGGEGGGFDRPGEAGEQKLRLAYDLRNWDHIADAVRIGKEMGIKTSAWYTLYEEAHFQTKISKFSEEHPEFWWQARDGKKRSSKVSFAAPDVRAHKLAMIDEQLAYGFDSIMLDYYRETQGYLGGKETLISGTEVDDNGVCIYGYEKPMIEAFRKATGKDALALANDDPEWLAFRVQQLTDFMADARKTVNKHKASVSVRVRSMGRMRLPLPWWEPENAPTNSLRGSFADWPTWAKKGYVDEVHLNLDNWDLFDGMSVEKVWDETKAARNLIGDSARLIIGFWTYNMEDRPLTQGQAAIEAFTGAAIRAGADGVCLWETTSLHGWACAPGGAGGRQHGVWPLLKRLSAEDQPSLHI